MGPGETFEGWPMKTKLISATRPRQNIRFFSYTMDPALPICPPSYLILLNWNRWSTLCLSCFFCYLFACILNLISKINSCWNKIFRTYSLPQLKGLYGKICKDHWPNQIKLRCATSGILVCSRIYIWIEFMLIHGEMGFMGELSNR